jgi:hypothetical protein
MSNESRRSQALTFDRDEWEMIVTLPRRVLLAAVAAEPVDGRTAAENIAGIEAIASGLASPSRLVRDVVGSIYAESHPTPEEEGREGGIVQTIAACRYASQLLATRCSAEDAAAYRDWLTHIAAVAAGVSQGVSGTAIGRTELIQSPFLYALAGVLRP